MERTEAKFAENPHRKTDKVSLCAQFGLRIMAISTAFAATWTIATAKQTVVVFGMQFDARYTYCSAFKFFAFANAFACAFTFLSLVFVFFSLRHGLTTTSFFLLFLHDLFMMSLMLSGVAAGTAVGYIGRYGNSHAGWMEICDRLKKYCDKVTASMVLSYLSVVCLVVLTVISAGKSRQI
ncbi:CASP-like protein 1F1 [Hibiscus syriacus]|uniref:CASP-like protein n=1 Tax=Hibiscus syriacus TaxID=106335 RepID=A0A6A2ZQ19_HIBSY|nr:CASP-like protein 1F1 [Hibiscus syriacus]KAE8693978.1 CASP-like protein 1F1 [Hibiscus syriacus]